MPYKIQSLPPAILHITQEKGTEHPFSGEYESWEKPGSFLCRQCGLALFRSYSKFHSGCGWASFDEEISQAVLRHPDADGYRTEILCSRCQAHLGHVFEGERFTAKNTRHCVNSLSLDFVEDLKVVDTEEAIFAAGCFWGVEQLFKQLPGVLKTEVGYTGGAKSQPTYQEVCSGTTGHVEAIRVIYDPRRISYTAITKYFFEIHSPTQADGQGPDRGSQYLSVIFYYHDEQKQIAQALIQQLIQKGYAVVTKILPVQVFWRAEDYHQDYYTNNGGQAYCHRYEKRFDD